MDITTTVKETIAVLERDFPGQIDQATIDAIIEDARRQRNEALGRIVRNAARKAAQGIAKLFAALQAHTHLASRQPRFDH